MKFEHLFSEGSVHGRKTQNRIILAPCPVTEEAIRKSGAGIILQGCDLMSPAGDPDLFHADADRIRKRLNAIHESGALASCHVQHFGLHSADRKGPSDGIRSTDGAEIFAMTLEDIRQTLERFSEFAVDAKKFGFDMIDLHLGHGWLGNQFLSRGCNHRTDAYGGSFENRARFPLEIIQTVRKAVGEDFPLTIRWSAVDYLKDGVTLKETLQFLKLAAPYLDGIEVSCGTDFEPEGHNHSQGNFLRERMPNVPFARKIKHEFPSLTVSVVSGILTPNEAEQILSETDIDFISIARAFLADPEWINKAKEGREREIVPCLRCNRCYRPEDKNCAVNLWLDYSEVHTPNEAPVPITHTLVPSDGSKTIAVVGAGPAGIHAALALDQAGYRTVLLDKAMIPGGRLRYLSEKDPSENRSYYAYLLYRLARSDVQLKTGIDVTLSALRPFSPSGIILATGAHVKSLSVPIDPDAALITADEALQDPNRIIFPLLIVGGGKSGVTFLLEHRDEEITLVESEEEILRDADPDFREYLKETLSDHPNLRIFKNASISEIRKNVVLVRDKDGNEQMIPASTVINASGMASILPAFEKELQNAHFPTIIIGDANHPGDLGDAIRDGETAAVRMSELVSGK